MRASVDPSERPHLSLILLLGAILLAALLLRMGLATGLPSLRRPDEIFQSLEPAFRLHTGTGIITWEWREGIRSPLFPGFLAGLMAVADALGLGPDGYLPLTRLALSVVALGAPLGGMLLGWRAAGPAGAVLAGIATAIWPDLLWLGPKSLSEVQAGNLLAAAMGLAVLATPQCSAPSAQRPRLALLVGIGVLLGLTFALRFHLAPAILVVAAWVGRLEIRARWLPMVIGGLLPVLLLGLTDHLAWGTPFHSIWRNVQMNVLEGVSLEYGVHSRAWYIYQTLSDWGAGAIFVGALFLLGMRAAPLPALVAAIVVLSHSALAHKESSFIYAALPAALSVAGIGAARLVLLLERRLAPPPPRIAAVGLAALLWVAVAGATALGGGFLPYWRLGAGYLEAGAVLRRQADLCGLGLLGADWYATGGSVHLGRAVPTYHVPEPGELASIAPAFNYLLLAREARGGIGGFEVLACYGRPPGQGDVCLARAAREGCSPMPEHELNSFERLGRADGLIRR